MKIQEVIQINVDLLKSNFILQEYIFSFFNNHIFNHLTLDYESKYTPFVSTSYREREKAFFGIDLIDSHSFSFPPIDINLYTYAEISRPIAICT